MARAREQPDGVTSKLRNTHDGDFIIAVHDFADLRDIEEVHPIRHLLKYQLLTGPPGLR